MRTSETMPPMIGDSPALLTMQEQISHLAPLDRPVLIIGERGSGKELVAARLHYLSRRWDQPFIKLNCAALAETLLDSELFGHEAGAFTGAQKRRPGRFELADNGTLFLDEIASASTAVQEKILRAVEYGEIDRLGGAETLRVNARVIAAANADLRELARQGKFRADLLDRLSFDVVRVPALRERPEDIPALAEHFAIQMAQELGWTVFPGFAPAALDQLLHHDWPGNVRELRNAVERSVARNGQDQVQDIILDPFGDPPPPAEKPEIGDFQAKVAAFERDLLLRALQQSRWNRRAAADLLNLSYDQLRRLIAKHDIV